MLKLAMIDVFLRLVPESILIMGAIYIFSLETINKRAYPIACVSYIIATYLVRLLPIHFGVHVILNIMVYSVISVCLMKISIIKSISSVLIIMIIMSICEWLNIGILTGALKMDVATLFNDSITRNIAMAPSLVFFTVILWLFYIRIYKTKRER